MNIVIDSTEFKKDRGLNKADISLIKDMGEEGLLTLHIPYFVYKECTTSSITDLRTELNQIKNNLKSFDRKGMGKSDFSNARKIEKEVSALYDNVEISNKELWDDFISESKAVLYDFDEKDSIAVFEAYFSGGKPFKSLKKRDDIPDAFIYETIKKISKDKIIYLVSGDSNLREKCADLKNLKIFPSFKELYDDSDFQKLELKYNHLKESQKVQDAKQLLIDHKDCFEDAVYDFTRRVEYLHLSETNLPSDNGDVTVYAIDNPEVTIDEENIKFIDDKFFVPIKVIADASVDYAVYKADYWANDNLPGISEDLNNHYYLLHDTLQMTLKKTISVPIENIQEDMPLNLSIEEFDEIEFE